MLVRNNTLIKMTLFVGITMKNNFQQSEIAKELFKIAFDIQDQVVNLINNITELYEIQKNSTTNFSESTEE